MNEMKLYKFQKTAVYALAQMLKDYKGAILRADEGLGKTYMAAELAKGKRAMWIGPAGSLKDVKKKVDAYDPDNTIEFVSYHGFGNIDKIPAKQLRLTNFFIFDEAHMLRNYSASWTQRFVRITTHGKRFLFTTATPAIRSPKDFVYILRKTGVYGDISTTAWYQRYFDAKPSKFGDFLEFGAFQNKEDFAAHMLKVSYDITQEQADRDMPPAAIEIKMLPGEFRVPKDITGETRARVDAGLLKSSNAVDYIRSTGRRALILTHFHGCAEIVAKKLGTNPALTPATVRKHIEDFRTGHRDYIVTTIGLTNSSYDLNECDQVYFVESSYSFMTDRQSMRRCLRLGKRTTLQVTYFALEGERPLLTSLKRKYLDSLKREKRFEISPSSLARLEVCPGSKYFKVEEDDTPNGAATIGTLHHEAAERLIRNKGIAIAPILDNTIQGYVEEARQLKDRLGMHGVEDCLAAPQIHAGFGGTVDFWAYDEQKRHLIVIDYKNGRWKVDAVGNRQLQAYALLICIAKGLDPKNIHTVIWQRGQRREATYTREEFARVRQQIEHIIEVVDHAKNEPEKWLGEHCDTRFCPARYIHQRQGESINE